jgi:hypothetical protein
LADSFVVRGIDDVFWLGSYFSPAKTILDRLESHVIADEVVFEDQTPEWAGITIFGESAGVRDIAGSDGSVFAGRRGGDTSEWVFPVTLSEATRKRLSDGVELDSVEVARRRIVAGIPAVPVDVGPSDLPNEGGLDVDAISYTKGCYLGQEVMARLKSMGQVRRRLLRVRAAHAAIPILPAPLFSGKRQLGELRSAAVDGANGFVGLAMLSLLHLQSGAALSFTEDGTPRVELIDAP